MCLSNRTYQEVCNNHINCFRSFKTKAISIEWIVSSQEKIVMPFLKDNNERTDSGHSNLGNENQPSRKIDNQFFFKKTSNWCYV